MKKISILLFTISTFSVFAQCPTYTKSYDGFASSDEGYNTIMTKEGGLALVSTASFVDGYLLKTDSCGVVEWSKKYDYNGQSDDFKAGIQTFDGGYVMIGTTFSSVTFKNDMFVVRTNSVGDTIWQKSIGGANNDYGRAIIETADTNYVLVGYTTSYGIGGNDIYVVKIDTSGNVITQKTYGATKNEQANAIINTMDGNIAIFGETKSYGSGQEDYYLMKLNTSLDSIWGKYYGGTKSDFGMSLVQTPDSGFAMAGGSGSYTTTSTQDFYIVKADKQGTFQWKKIYDSGFIDVANSIDNGNNGALLVTGTFPVSGSDYDMYLMELNSNGTTVFAERHGGTGMQRGNSVKSIGNNGWLALGFTDTSNAGDIYLVKGLQQAVVGVQEEAKDVKDVSIYPNPAKEKLIIDNGKVKIEKLELYNVLGERVFHSIPNINQSITIDVSALPSGVYFLKLKTEKGDVTKKVIRE